VLAAARGGRQLPRPEQLNVARRTLALSLRGWHGGPRPQQHLLAHDRGAALGDRVAAPLGERREAFQAARKRRNLVSDAHVELTDVGRKWSQENVGPAVLRRERKHLELDAVMGPAPSER